MRSCQQMTDCRVFVHYSTREHLVWVWSLKCHQTAPLAKRSSNSIGLPVGNRQRLPLLSSRQGRDNTLHFQACENDTLHAKAAADFHVLYPKSWVGAIRLCTTMYSDRGKSHPSYHNQDQAHCRGA